MTTEAKKFEDVRTVHMMRAGPMKFAAYKVYDPETGQYGPLQFHLAYDSTVLAVMSEEVAKFFSRQMEIVTALQAGEIAHPHQTRLPGSYNEVYQSFRAAGRKRQEAVQ